MRQFSYRNLARILKYCSFVLLLSCAAVPSNSESLSTGLLWEIESPQLAVKSFLFGTIHSEDPRVTKIAGPVKEAFDNAKIFVLEVELDAASSQAVASYLYFTDGRSLNEVLNKDLYGRTLTAMSARGMPADVVARMKPWAVFTVLNMPEAETGEFLDAILYQQAQQQNKTIHALESIKEQLDVFDKMSLQTQISLLKVTLDNQAEMDVMLDEAIQLYLTRDMAKIESLNKKYTDYLEPEIAKIFTARLLIERNHRMVERMIPILKQGNVFVAVGALHLPGKQGIIKLLSDKGYKVRPIY